MSLFADCNKGPEITDFRGPNLLLDAEDVSAPAALDARNVEFIDGSVQTRRGFGVYDTPAKAITSLFNWVRSDLSNYRMTWHSGNTLTRRDLINFPTNIDVDIITGLSAAAAVFAEAGYRLFVAMFGTNGRGVTGGEARVWDGTLTSGVPNVEKCFQRPMISPTEFTVATSEPGAGIVTTGSHRIGLIFNTYAGHTTRVGPWDTAGAFTFITHAATGSKNLQIALTPVGNWPSWVVSATVVMTTVQNPNRYFIVPGATIQIVRNSNFVAQLATPLSIDDTNLSARSAVDVNEAGYFDLLALSTGNTGPFQPYFITTYNDRLVYITETLGPDASNQIASALYVSRKGSPMWITDADHKLFLPGFRRITCAQQLGPSLFVFGPSWTFAYNDNTADPSSWPTPRTVDSHIGTPFPRGVCPSVSRGYAWVGDRTGLYNLSGGNYSRIPSSYYETPDWEKINFNAQAQTFEIVEDPNRRMVFVKAAVDLGSGAPSAYANALLVWDYTQGVEAGKIKYCGLWPIAAIPQIGAIGLFLHPTNGRNELWASSNQASPGKVWRLKSTPTDAVSIIYNDDGVGYDSYYRIATTKVHPTPAQMIGIDVRARGAGVALLSAHSLDNERTQALIPLNLSTTPGKVLQRFFNMQTEMCSVRISNNAVANAYWILSRLQQYWTPWSMQR